MKKINKNSLSPRMYLLLIKKFNSQQMYHPIIKIKKFNSPQMYHPIIKIKKFNSQQMYQSITLSPKILDF